MARRKRSRQQAEPAPRVQPRVVVINQETVWTWAVDGKVNVSYPIGHNPFPESDGTPPVGIRGDTTLTFSGAGSERRPSSDGLRLALAVLEGDGVAALLLADLVRDAHLAGV